MKEVAHYLPTRRDFLRKSRAFATTLAVLESTNLFAQTRLQKREKLTSHTVEEVSPSEDLMREHGVLNRLLLIYEETLTRLNKGQDFPSEVLTGAADLIRRFIEDYHEKLEEEYLFPRFEKGGKLIELVKILRQQHQTGRRLSEAIKSGMTLTGRKNREDHRKLAEDLQLFIRMYRPHEAREDTVLFPAFRSLVSPHEYDALGETFEDREHALFGKDGFETVVDEVAKLEKILGIYDLSQFTPQI